MSKKVKIAIIISAVFVFAFTFAVIFGGLWMTCHTPKSVRKDMYNYYSDDATYLTIYGDAYFKIDYTDDMTVTITLTEDCVQALNQTQNKIIFATDKSYTYAIYETNRKALEDNGFYGVLNEVIKDGSTTYYRVDEPVTLIINDRRDDRAAVAVSVIVGETCYLDFDTGKANLLYYVQNIMK